MQPVNTKSNFVKRFTAGEFGNRTPIWNSLEEFQQSRQYKQQKNLYCLRSYKPSDQTLYQQTREEIERAYNPEKHYITQRAPPKGVVIQGEVIYNHKGLVGFVSFVKDTMKPSLAAGGFELTGLELLQTLRRYMDISSYEWLQHLINSYPGHTIEFSVFVKYIGNIPRRNTIFWEVRRY